MRRLITAAAIACAVPLHGVAAQAPSGFKAEFLGNFSQIENKFYQLADAMSAKYDWRPGAGVRSVCEVFMHIAVDNYMLGGAFGVAMPAGMSGPDTEKCAGDKAKVTAVMKASFDAIKARVSAMSDADLDAKYTLFGANQTRRAWLLATAEHAGEHLGQSIAYARMNGVVPPWSK
jgi:hypothetical protein